MAAKAIIFKYKNIILYRSDGKPTDRRDVRVQMYNTYFIIVRTSNMS